MPGGKPWLRLTLLVAALAAASPATAESAPADRHDLLTSVRALNFLKPVPAGSVQAAIVYPDGDAAGKAEAGQLAALFGDGLSAGAITVHPVIIPESQLSTLAAAIVILTPAAITDAAAIAHALAGRAILTVAFNKSPVEADQIVMAVTSAPRVEIIVSRTAAQRAGLTFATAFRMMILER